MAGDTGRGLGMRTKNDWLRDQFLEPEEEVFEIRRRAYELYDQRGRQQGRALEDWLTAEREIKECRDWLSQRVATARKALHR